MKYLAPHIAVRALVLVALAGAVVAAGCAPKTRPEPAPVNVPEPPPRDLPTPNRDVVSEFTRRGIDAREAEEGVVIYLPTVYLFAFDSATVESDAQQHLRQIADLLNAEFLTGRTIVVEGHADAIGAEAYNKALSEKRADAVIGELVSAGVDRDRLTKRAFGKERPLEPNKRPDGSDNPEGRARNRRVALIVENPKP